MSAFVRLMLLLAVAGVCTPAPAGAQAPATTAAAGTVPPETRAQVLQRFRVLVIRDGIVLTSRRTPGQTIEITNGSIAIDGANVTGRELRDQLGTDADLVLQLSYLAPEALRAEFAPPTPPGPPAPPASRAPAAPPRRQRRTRHPRPRHRRRRRSHGNATTAGAGRAAPR